MWSIGVSVGWYAVGRDNGRRKGRDGRESEKPPKGCGGNKPCFLKKIPAKKPKRGRFKIEGGPDGGAATRAASMFVAQFCGLG